jgi:surfeit locus 1 family protein
MRITFRFRLIPFIAAAIAVAIGLSLAQWQTRRATEKIELAEKLQARQSAPAIRLDAVLPNSEDIEFRRIIVKGEFLRDWPIYLDNRPNNGVAGFYLLMPFKISSSNLHVLIARGWIPRNPADRMKVPPIIAPDGTIEIEGLARLSIGHVMQLGEVDAPRPHSIVQNLDVADFAESTKLNMQPIIVEQLSDTRDGLIRTWPLPSTGVEKHRGYAFQWYALAAMAFIFFVVTGFRRGKK